MVPPIRFTDRRKPQGVTYSSNSLASLEAHPIGRSTAQGPRSGLRSPCAARARWDASQKGYPLTAAAPLDLRPGPASGRPPPRPAHRAGPGCRRSPARRSCASRPPERETSPHGRRGPAHRARRQARRDRGRSQNGRRRPGGVVACRASRRGCSGAFNTPSVSSADSSPAGRGSKSAARARLAGCRVIPSPSSQPPSASLLPSPPPSAAPGFPDPAACP